MLLIVLAGIYIFNLFHIYSDKDEELHDYFSICCVFLTSGTLFKITFDAVTLELGKKITMALPETQWILLKDFIIEPINFISLKWVVMLEFAYLPSVVYIIFNFLLSGKVYKEFSLTIPMAKAVILTMCTASYE